MDFQVSEEMNLVVMRIAADPHLADLDDFFERHLGHLIRNGVNRLVSDLRQLKTSEMDAAKLRARMARADAIVRENAQPDDSVLRMAVLAQPGTLGQGMGRMMVGQKWGLGALEISVFEGAKEAGEWLGLRSDWMKQSGFS